MRLTIIPEDGTVQIDGVAYLEIDLRQCGIPENIHALQWYESWGEIEYIDKANLRTEALPEWATACATAWESADLKAKNPPEPPEPTLEELAKNLRMEKQYAFQTESDPLFFKWQAGESTKEEWEAKRAEIKARYPEEQA